MRHRTAVVILLILCALSGPASASYARDEGTVGYKTVTVPTGDSRAIPCAVWFPAAGGESRAVYDFGRNTRTGSAFTDSMPDTGDGPYPVVIYSHGYSGCSIASAYLCEALAGAGFVVAAPDHSDDLKVCSLSPGFHREPFIAFKILFSAAELGNRLAEGRYDIEDFRYRYHEIKATIDYLTAEGRDNGSIFHNLIDVSRIGAVGHSLGGFSVMVAAGARDVGIDFPIDAVVAMSGPGGDVFTCADMKRITIPAMLMYGGREAKRQRKETGIVAQNRCLAGPKFLMALVGGDHLSFSEGMLRDSSRDGGPRREADVRHDLISRYVTAFFAFYLVGDDRAKGVLRERDQGLAPYFYSF